MSITELLGIEYPIFQGTMARIATHEIAGAVSESGGHIGQTSTMSLLPQNR